MKTSMNDEYEIKVRPITKHHAKELTWSKKILDSIRNYVLREFDSDFVNKSKISFYTGISEIEVGRCLKILTQEGILRISRGYLDPNLSINSKRQLKFLRKKNPDKIHEYDKIEYYIVRGPAFIQACEKYGFPPDPTADWVCPQCHKANSITSLQCHNTNYLKSYCDYKRTNYKQWPTAFPTCEKCNQIQTPGKNHKDEECNMIIVKGIH